MKVLERYADWPAPVAVGRRGPRRGIPYQNPLRVDRRMLSLLEEYILIQRGHLPARPWNLSEIARLLGVTPERVRQIETSALAALREHLELKEWAA